MPIRYDQVVHASRTAFVIALLLTGYVIVASATATTLGPIRWLAALIAAGCYLAAAYRPVSRRLAAAGYGREAHD